LLDEVSDKKGTTYEFTIAPPPAAAGKP